MKPVVTYQSPNGAKKTLCAEHSTLPLRDCKGSLYCNVSYGLHEGTCEVCAWESDDSTKLLRADLAALREALRVIAEMADEQREHFNEVWDRVDPKNNWDGNAANVRGGYISIAGKARAVLARVQGKEAE